MARFKAMQKRRETGRLVLFVIRASWCVLALASQSCGSEKSARAEANEVLERIARLDRLDASTPIDAQRAAIATLSTVPVTIPELEGLRSVCLKAYQGLFDSEVIQGEVRKALDGATPEQVPALQAKLEQAAATRVSAEAAHGTCQKLRREATVRYR
jgi:hypothetical protein